LGIISCIPGLDFVHDADPAYESRTDVGGKIYVPRDETFASIKETTFINNCMKGLLHKVAPSVWKALTDTRVIQGSPFSSFNEIENLYDGRQREGNAAEDLFSAAGLGFLKGPTDFLRNLPLVGILTSLVLDNCLEVNYPTPELISSKLALLRLCKTRTFQELKISSTTFLL
jgi:hypothetical protein